MPIYAGKICDMGTLLKYEKNAAISEICGNLKVTQGHILKMNRHLVNY